MSYRVDYIGLSEGYDIVKTLEKPNNYDIFKTFKEAKKKALANAKNDIKLVKYGYESTKKIKKAWNEE